MRYTQNVVIDGRVYDVIPVVIMTKDGQVVENFGSGLGEDEPDVSHLNKEDTQLLVKDALDDILAKISGDAATQTTLAAILAKIIAAPATEAKQDVLNGKDFATQTTLAAILAKLVAAPALEGGNLATIAGKDFATQTTLAAILAKLVAAPALETGNLKSLFDFFNQIAVVTGANTGVKGLRVYGGPTDPISDIPVKMDFDHHQIHEGEAFRWSVYVSSLANNATKDIQIVVPQITVAQGVPVVARMPHFRFEIVSSGDGLVQFYETPTISVAGSARTPVAMERNGTYTPQVQIKEDPTVTGVGTLIWQGLNTSSKNAASAIDNSSNEFVLKNNTTYLLRATSLTNSNKVLLRMVWYEDLGV